MGSAGLQLVEHGRPALDALDATLGALKDRDPLTAVTVAVPHPWAGLSLRRSMAARPGGVVNVRFVVLPRVAELLGAPSLAAQGQRPRTPTVARAAVRATLRHDPGDTLRPVADHPATEAAAARLVDELAAVGPRGRRLLAGVGARTADLVAFAERALDAAPGRYDRHDQARAAAEAVRAGHAAVAELGHLVIHLPTRLSPAELDLVAALAAAERATVLLGITGEPHADTPLARLQARLEPHLGPAVRPGGHVTPPVAQLAISTTDPDDEVRCALRTVVERWHGGTPLERMAVLYPSHEPYARLVQEQAAAADLPLAATSTSTLASSVVGRTLLGALSLVDEGLPRDAVIGWLAGAPVHQPDGRPVPTTRWDLLSRRAGVVGGGVAGWRHHLDAALDQLADDAARWRRDADPEVVSERIERERSEIHRLREFVEWLDAELHALDGAASWASMAGRAATFLRSLLGPESRRAGWPAEQVAAGEAVLQALERLGALDEIEPGPRAAAFRRALAAELDSGGGRRGEFGRGLLVAPLHHAVGLDLDLVVVVGLAEGTLPSRTSDDALLPDADRARAEVDLPRRSDAVDEQHHRLLAAMAAAPTRVLVTPRGDLRQGRERLPSRWLLDSVSAHEGRRLTAESLTEVGSAAMQVVPSFAAGLARAPEAISLAERDLADLLNWTTAGRRAAEHPLVEQVPGLRTGFAVLGARRRGFTRFNGRVQGVEIPTFEGGVALSPTALERWPVCPRRYFFAQVLRLRAHERPEVIDRIVATDRGSLVHDVLDRFFAEVVARPSSKDPDEPWSAAERARLHEILAEVSSRFEERGLTGRRVLWALDRATIGRDLERFLDHDEHYRRTERARPLATELPFGPDREASAVLDLPGGRRMSFRGFADRLDRTDDGRLVVLDYKTGRLSPDVRAIEKDDPVVRGTKLQLPVYALAAADHAGTDGPVRAAYWFISEAGRFEQVGYDKTPETDARFVEVLTTIADGIEGGVFPARPGAPNDREGHANCRFCDFDDVCGDDRTAEWERVRLAPELSGLLALTGDRDDDESADDPGAAGAAAAARSGTAAP